jgi:hypothetical protein
MSCCLSCRDDADGFFAFGVGYDNQVIAQPTEGQKTTLSVFAAICHREPTTAAAQGFIA